MADRIFCNRLQQKAGTPRIQVLSLRNIKFTGKIMRHLLQFQIILQVFQFGTQCRVLLRLPEGITQNKAEMLHVIIDLFLMICQRHPMNRIQRIHQKMRIDLIHQLFQLQIRFFFFLPLLTLNQLLNLRFHLIERCKKLIVFRKLNRCLCLRKISFSKMTHFFFQYFDRMRYQPDL